MSENWAADWVQGMLRKSASTDSGLGDAFIDVPESFESEFAEELWQHYITLLRAEPGAGERLSQFEFPEFSALAYDHQRYFVDLVGFLLGKEDSQAYIGKAFEGVPVHIAPDHDRVTVGPMTGWIQVKDLQDGSTQWVDPVLDRQWIAEPMLEYGRKRVRESFPELSNHINSYEMKRDRYFNNLKHDLIENWGLSEEAITGPEGPFNSSIIDTFNFRWPDPTSIGPRSVKLFAKFNPNPDKWYKDPKNSSLKKMVWAEVGNLAHPVAEKYVKEHAPPETPDAVLAAVAGSHHRDSGGWGVSDDLMAHVDKNLEKMGEGLAAEFSKTLANLEVPSGFPIEQYYDQTVDAYISVAGTVWDEEIRPIHDVLQELGIFEPSHPRYEELGFLQRPPDSIEHAGLSLESTLLEVREQLRDLAFGTSTAPQSLGTPDEIQAELVNLLSGRAVEQGLGSVLPQQLHEIAESLAGQLAENPMGVPIDRDTLWDKYGAFPHEGYEERADSDDRLHHGDMALAASQVRQAARPRWSDEAQWYYDMASPLLIDATFGGRVARELGPQNELVADLSEAHTESGPFKELLVQIAENTFGEAFIRESPGFVPTAKSVFESLGAVRELPENYQKVFTEYAPQLINHRNRRGAQVDTMEMLAFVEGLKDVAEMDSPTVETVNLDEGPWGQMADLIPDKIRIALGKNVPGFYPEFTVLLDKFNELNVEHPPMQDMNQFDVDFMVGQTLWEIGNTVDERSYEYVPDKLSVPLLESFHSFALTADTLESTWTVVPITPRNFQLAKLLADEGADAFPADVNKKIRERLDLIKPMVEMQEKWPKELLDVMRLKFSQGDMPQPVESGMVSTIVAYDAALHNPTNYKDWPDRWGVSDDAIARTPDGMREWLDDELVDHALMDWQHTMEDYPVVAEAVEAWEPDAEFSPEHAGHVRWETAKHFAEQHYGVPWEELPEQVRTVLKQAIQDIEDRVDISAMDYRTVPAGMAHQHLKAIRDLGDAVVGELGLPAIEHPEWQRQEMPVGDTAQYVTGARQLLKDPESLGPSMFGQDAALPPAPLPFEYEDLSPEEIINMAFRGQISDRDLARLEQHDRIFDAPRIGLYRNVQNQFPEPELREERKNKLVSMFGNRDKWREFYDSFQGRGDEGYLNISKMFPGDYSFNPKKFMGWASERIPWADTPSDMGDPLTGEPAANLNTLMGGKDERLAAERANAEEAESRESQAPENPQWGDELDYLTAAERAPLTDDWDGGLERFRSDRIFEGLLQRMSEAEAAGLWDESSRIFKIARNLPSLGSKGAEKRYEELEDEFQLYWGDPRLTGDPRDPGGGPPLGSLMPMYGTDADPTLINITKGLGRSAYRGFERTEGILNPISEAIEETAFKGIRKAGGAAAKYGAARTGALAGAASGFGKAANVAVKAAGPLSIAFLAGTYGYGLSQGLGHVDALKQAIGVTEVQEIGQRTAANWRDSAPRGPQPDGLAGAFNTIGRGISAFGGAVKDTALGVFGLGPDDEPQQQQQPVQKQNVLPNGYTRYGVGFQGRR